ncbi:beta-ketoacyl reductase [Streptomyces sp. CAS3]
MDALGVSNGEEGQGDIIPREQAASRGMLLRPGWAPALHGHDMNSRPVASGRWAVLGGMSNGGGDQLLRALAGTGIQIELVPDLTSLSTVPDLLLVPCASDTGAEPPDAARSLTHRMVGLLQQWIANRALYTTRLIVLTDRAVATTPAEPPGDLAAAAVTGLIRSAQWEVPGRLMLADHDRTNSSYRALSVAIGLGSREVAIRGGTIYLPALGAGDTEASARSCALNPEGTVLITGGTGLLGGLTAARLVAEHGARHLLLASRRGQHAPGAARLAAELRACEAEVTIAACDVADSEDLGHLLAGISSRHPVTAIVHAAGTTDDATVRSLTPERIDTVLLPKIAGAWNLNRLTRDLNLASFVVYSSVFSVLGNAGQGAYCAANAFLNALVHQRCTEGRSALSLAWGWWAQSSQLTQHMNQRLGARLARCGVNPTPAEDGLALLDTALGQKGHPVLITGDFDFGRLQEAHRLARPADLRQRASDSFPNELRHYSE